MNEAQQQPNLYDTGYVPEDVDKFGSLWSEHLDATEIITYIEYMLKGYELNEENKWVPSMMSVYDEEGNKHEIPEGPLMAVVEIRIIMTWLRSHLNSNTFLSKLTTEQINNIMYEIVWTMEKVFYKLRFKLPPHIRGILSNTLENAIFIGLNRDTQSSPCSCQRLPHIHFLMHHLI
jgi:hypothetical protein